MKLTIQQGDLQKALNVVAHIVPSKTTLPVLTCVLLEAENGKLTVSATNLDLSIVTSTTEVNVEKPGRTAVPAAKFVSFIRSLGAGEVKLEEKGGRCQVVSGKAAFTESSMNADEFPALPELAAAGGFDVDAAALSNMIRSTAYAVSRDETRPALMGILWEIKPTSLGMVATDAHRLARIERKMDWSVKDLSNVITDTQGLLQFVRLADGIETTHVHLGDKQLSFRLGETVLHTRLLEGPFPDYTAVIPQSNSLEVTVDREAMMASVRRVAITADRITCQIRLGIESGRMEMSATGTDGSRTEDELPAGYAGEAMEIGFNFNYLQDVLKNIGTDTIQLAMKDSQSAALVRPVDAGQEAGDLVCLLMPLRLTSD